MKIVALSDTHYKHLEVEVPPSDVLIVAGDFMSHGSRTEIPHFRDWLNELPHELKIVIAGNHDWAFEEHLDEARFLLLGPGIQYVQDQSLTWKGVKFYGSPWQPDFFNWAFNLPRGEELAAKWALIPDDTDVLITHGPPAGILDKNAGDQRFGCYDLEMRVHEVKPKIHIFGHAHSSYGYMNRQGIDFYNVALADENYDIVRTPVEIEIENDRS